MNKKIRILSKTGNIYYRNCQLTDYIDNKGIQFTIAYGKNATYSICKRDYTGAIWKKVK